MSITINMTSAQADRVLRALVGHPGRDDVRAVTRDDDRVDLVVPPGLVGEVDALDWDVEPPAPVPEQITMAQARAVLIANGHFDTVEAALASDTSGQGKIHYAAWEYSPTIRRDSALVTSMAALLSLSDAQVDDLFRSAGALQF